MVPRMVRSRQRVTRDAPAGREFAVAAARRESADAAVAMLEAGGNAVDAAIACGFVAGVVEPGDTCLAGSGLMIVSDPAGGDLAVEFPPRAPAAARPDMYEVISSAGATKLLGVSVVAGDANADGILAPGRARHGRGAAGRPRAPRPPRPRAGDGAGDPRRGRRLRRRRLPRAARARAPRGAAGAARGGRVCTSSTGLPPRARVPGRDDAGGRRRGCASRSWRARSSSIAARGAAGFYEGEVADGDRAPLRAARRADHARGPRGVHAPRGRAAARAATATASCCCRARRAAAGPPLSCCACSSASRRAAARGRRPRSCTCSPRRRRTRSRTATRGSATRTPCRCRWRGC